MALTLFLDVTNKKLLKSREGPALCELPQFFYASKLDLTIFPRDINPDESDRDNPYIAVDWTGYTFTLSIGASDAADSTSPVVFQDTFTETPDTVDTDGVGINAIIDFHTQELKDLIGEKSSVKTFLELKAQAPLATDPEVLLQTSIFVNGIVYDPDSMPTPVNSYVSRFITGEVPTGTVDASNVTFTLANTPIAGTVEIFQDGVRLKNTLDYTISGSTITFITAPELGAILLANYIK